MPNRLAGETSPYLLQHADNPVDWHPWGEAALSLARRENKPILLSIGYSACHWCHVMAHESFEDADVAAVMNRLFVNIKVDREERPDLDQIYQTVHGMLTQRNGGWPLTLFMTPDGTPFFAGTYFPKTPRYGLPGFAELCSKLAEAFNRRRDDIERQNAAVRAALAKSGDGKAPMSLDETIVGRARDSLMESFDPEWGGFGGAPKFPHVTDLALLLRQAVTRNDSEALRAVVTTLTRMAEGGIFDQIGGGFARYSVDGRWEIPHFEKMLYDNGPLLAIYADAWVATRNPLFERIVVQTAAWVMREMQAPIQSNEGGYYSSLDADSEGEEGKFYVWSREEVRDLLSPAEWQIAERHWGLDAPPNFENSHWHLRVAAPLADADAGQIKAARDKLFARRDLRIRPGRDDKVLTSWNALMIQGMARAGRIFDRADWVTSAQQAVDFVRATLVRDGHLLTTYKDGKAHLNAYLDDHAFLLAALLESMQAEFRPEDLAFATRLADDMLERFEDLDRGGFFFTSHDHEALIQRTKTGYDNATPSGNGVAAVALQRLGHLLGETRYLAAAQKTLDCFSAQFSAQTSGYSTLIEAMEEALTPTETIVLSGPERDLREWSLALAALPLPHTLTLALRDDLSGLPATLTKPGGRGVSAWVCRGVNCLPAITTLNQLLAEISTPSRAL